MNPIRNKNESFLLKKKCLSKKFINHLLFNGKKMKASTIFYKTLSGIKKKITYYRSPKNEGNSKIEKNLTLQQKSLQNYTSTKVLYRAINNIKPSLEVRKVRIAGTTYHVPAILSKKRQERLAMKWLLVSAKKKKKNLKILSQIV